MAYDDSLSNRLTAVRAAINECLIALSSMVATNAGQRSKRMAELKDLMQIEMWLCRQLGYQTGEYGPQVVELDTTGTNGNSVTI